jgi:SAM-dependent methyltransferase
MIRLLKRIVPDSVKQHLRARLQREISAGLEPNDILGVLYTPSRYRIHGPWLTWDRENTDRRSDGLPLPPSEFRMGHADDDAGYLAAGRTSSEFIRRILEREGVALTPGHAILEWGCAGGRVLRHFAPEAGHSEVWGIDQHGPSISWCKRNLSPPFKFMTCTAFPHLPFADNIFSLVYAGSVFTHILHLMDMWVMEFRRILKPGGLALFTVHDEHTWQYLATRKDQKRIVDPGGLEEFAGTLDHEVSFLQAGGDWNRVVSFLRSDWIMREWGQYLEVVSVEPLSESYQATVVLRKPGAASSAQ